MQIPVQVGKLTDGFIRNTSGTPALSCNDQEKDYFFKCSLILAHYNLQFLFLADRIGIQWGFLWL